VKPRKREVNIFNMSVLDLLTGALGAFCFLTLALFPSYFKTQKSSAPEQRPQLGKTKNGIPPFSLARIQAADDKGERCGALRLDSLQAPHGNKSFRQLPFKSPEVEGYKRAVYLFIFDPGPYNLTITAMTFNKTGTCHLSSYQYTPHGSRGLTVLLTSSPASYPFNFEVKPDQLITSILPGR
jgi:hypothetical protein